MYCGKKFYIYVNFNFIFGWLEEEWFIVLSRGKKNLEVLRRRVRLLIIVNGLIDSEIILESSFMENIDI